MHRYRLTPTAAPRALYSWSLTAFATTVAVWSPIANGASPNPRSDIPPICVNLQNCTNVDAWGFQVEVGVEGQTRQSLCLVPSTVINATYVLGPQICQNDSSNRTCQASHGGTFDAGAATGFIPRNTSKLDGAEGFWDDLNGPVQTFGDVDFALAGFTQLEGYEIGVVTNGSMFNLGQLGLGPQSTFLRALKSRNYIDRLMFGFDAGSQSPYSPRQGHLVLGGYDQSRVVGNFAEFDINYDNMDFRPCPFRVEIRRVDVEFEKDRETTAFIDMESRNSYACIEPYDNLFRFPAGRLASLDSIGFGERRVPSNWLPDLQINEPGWRYKVGGPPAFSLNIVLKGNDEDFQIAIPNEQLQHPLRGIDKDGQYAVDANYTELNVFQGSAVRNTIVFGKAFLSQVYLAVDYEAGKFYLGASSPSSTSLCNPTRFGSSGGGGGGSGGGGKARIAGYVGLAFGVVAFVVVAAALGTVLWMWKSGRLDRYRRRGVNITERDIDFGTYKQQNTKDMRQLARQASLHP
ncbi:hypothetical protein DRE_05996 [Drechslerella stenobrocha 248]|uniref:Peptidase A1 domain-containing protein n=1 Tax=Drechslerella stenobrocha 248 TaxID=1043628 RepID=W7HQ41_9PEZI|nr:hypothetical protein DRE_05996 [Drechslerella stenobrocha 248]